MTYAKHVSRKVTPQNKPIPGSGQVQNNAGGFGWEVSPWESLERFLILGTTGGSFYASEQKMTTESAQKIEECLNLDHKRTIDRIVEVSDQGLAPKNDPAIFALALAASNSQVECRQYALENLNKVCRIGTHLFRFVQELKELRSFGRSVRRALRRWYVDRTTPSMCLQLGKYQSRNGWSHRDILRLIHIRPGVVVNPTPEQLRAIAWACQDDASPEGLPYLELMERAKTADKAELVQIINQGGLPWEMLPTESLRHPEIWEALLANNLPMEAMIRQLGRLSNIGLLLTFSDTAKEICRRLDDQEEIHKSRLHPLKVLTALSVYRTGRGVKGSLSWTPVQNVVDALDEAFYKAFDNVIPTGKNFLLALDVSASMTWSTVADSFLTPREASAALAMVTLRTEPYCEVVAFCDHLKKVEISKKDRLNNVVATINRMYAGGTDCALPMLYADQYSLPIDAFVVYTDSDTWAGNIHPSQALLQFRNSMKRPKAKLAVVGMVSNGFSIADPNDPGMLDFVGFNASMPSTLEAFVNS